MIDGEEGREFVRHVVRNKKLDKLAQLWVSGMDVDWDLLYEDPKPQRISLPTYPFAKERYWVPDPGPLPAAHPGTKRLHPLVHENTSTLDQEQFTATFAGTEFFIRDHVVLDEKMLPGVAYLEMAVAATRLAGISKVHKLKDVVWTHPIRVNANPEIVTISLHPETDRIAYEVTTQNPSDDTPIVHGQGRGHHGPGPRQNRRHKTFRKPKTGVPKN